MSLFRSSISQVTGRGTHLFAGKTTFLFNGEGVYGLTVDNITQSRFFYNLNLKNDQAGIVRVESILSVEDVFDYVNRGYVNKFVTLTVYKEPNISSDTEDCDFHAKDICLAYDVDMGAVVYIRQGQHLDRIMVTESINDILSETVSTTTTTTFPGGITISSATVTGTNPNVLRITVTGGTISAATMTGVNRISNVLTVNVNGSPITMTGVTYWVTAGIHINMYLGEPAVEAAPTDVITITYDHDAGGGMGWGDGAGEYLEDFTDFPVTNLVTTTTSTTSTTSTSSTTSTTSTSSTSTSSTSTSSTSSTTTSSTSTTTPDDDEIWTDGVDIFRLQVRDGALYLDQAITPTGFAGVEDTDWSAIQSWQVS